MTLLELIAIFSFIILCVIFCLVFRIKRSLENIESYSGRILSENLDITKKILFQLGGDNSIISSLGVSGDLISRYPLSIHVLQIRNELSAFRHKWYEHQVFPERAREESERYNKEIKIRVEELMKEKEQTKGTSEAQ